MPKVRRSKSLKHATRKSLRTVRLSDGEANTSTEDHTAPSRPDTPQNPQATFLGLPAELRLSIYELLLEDSLVHIHAIKSRRDDEPARLISRPCHAPHAKSAILCAHPRDDESVRYSQRCIFSTPKHSLKTGILALRTVCRLIHGEYEAKVWASIGISLQVTDFDFFVKQTPERVLQSLRRITLCGYYSSIDAWDPSFQARDCAPFSRLAGIFPRLTHIGYQDTMHHYPLNDLLGYFKHKSEPLHRSQGWRELAIFRNFFLKLDPKITVAWYVCGRTRMAQSTKNRHIRVVMVRDGKKGAGIVEGENGWADGDVKIELHESHSR